MLPARPTIDLPEAVRANSQPPRQLGNLSGSLSLARATWCGRVQHPTAGIALGPYRLTTDASDAGDLVVFDAQAEERAAAVLRDAGHGVTQVQDEQRQRLELAAQLEVVSRAVLAVTGELALDTVLRRLVDLARELSGARYAALGVPPDHGGDLVAFLTSG